MGTGGNLSGGPTWRPSPARGPSLQVSRAGQPSRGWAGAWQGGSVPGPELLEASGSKSCSAGRAGSCVEWPPGSRRLLPGPPLPLPQWAVRVGELRACPGEGQGGQGLRGLPIQHGRLLPAQGLCLATLRKPGASPRKPSLPTSPPGWTMSPRKALCHLPALLGSVPAGSTRGLGVASVGASKWWGRGSRARLLGLGVHVQTVWGATCTSSPLPCPLLGRTRTLRPGPQRQEPPTPRV